MAAKDDQWPGQMLHQATIYNNVELLVCLLHGDEIAFINSKDVCGRTAVYTAVSNGSTECLKVLLDHGADSNIPAGARCHNMAPLHEAVLNSKVEALSILLECGADLNAVDVSGKTPLSLAKYIKNREVITIIDREKQKRKCVMEQLSRDLCGACALGDYAKVENVLQSCGPYRRHVINMATKGLSPLAIASKCGYADILCLLLSESTQCSAQRDTGLTLLHLACESGHRDVIDILQQSFPELTNMRSIEHQLPLHVAVIHNRVEAVKALLNFPYSELLSFEDSTTGTTYSCGLELNGRDSFGETPLHIACRHNFIDIIKVLVNFSVQVEVKKKTIPRSTSLRSRTFDLEKSLGDDDENEEDVTAGMTNSVEFESSTTTTTSASPTLTPSEEHHYHHHHHQSLKPKPSSLVLFFPVDINTSNIEGLSPFHMAIRYGCTEAVQVMLSCRALPPPVVRTKDREYSVLMYAYEYGNMDILKLLLSYGFVDTDNKVLSSAFFSKDQESECLLLTHKSSKDQAHTINKVEMKKMAYQTDDCIDKRFDHRHHQLTSCAETSSSLDQEHRVKYPNTPVAINWNNVGMLADIEPVCLANACRLHNPSLPAALEMSIIFCALTKVDISKNSFRKFPSILLKLPSLVLLKASRNEISEIPDNCDVLCISLEELHLNENRLTSLPKFVFQFPALKYLDVSVNRLTETPPEMWAAMSLISLNLSNNRLTALPAIPVDHPMHRLHTSGGSTTAGVKFRKASMGSFRREVTNSFSESVSSSVEGGENSKDNSSIYFIGDSSKDSMVDFTVLSMQEVSTNSIVRINKWSSGLSVVDRDPWKASGQVSGLKQLWLSKNKLTQIPAALSCCAPCLEVLDMSENPLLSAGSMWDYPASLIELNLSKAGLSSLDCWRAPLDASQDSGYHGSGQGSLASSYSKTSASCSSLRDFYNANSCPHRSHGSLAKLEKLNLSSNCLATVCLARDPQKDNKQADAFSVCSMESEEIQGRLLFPILSELNLSGNKLFSLPPEIGELSGLKILSLERNPKLRELPPKLGLLKNLWKLDLKLCPLDGAIQDFLHNSRFPVKDILGFLQSVLEESTEYNCMNLMLVGFHKIGKTSLLQRLCEKGRMIQKSTHWRDRVNKESGSKGQTTLLSTVGIDINQLVLEKKTKGPVVFRTWDFGGQREYYATHQYFLSPRSLYLVVWSIIDGERGVESLLLWLVNIQARAPGSSVIIVGTHLDILRDKATKNNFPADFEESMMLLMEKMFLSNQEPDKSGLPNILMAINVSCKTGENIKRLVDAIYDCVFELKHPKSRTQFLVNQKIPRKYLLLQNIIRELADERIRDAKEPVLNRSKYTLCVQNKMMENGMTFRDVEELEQATRFLHENGVLFHYDDLPLSDLFFLDPQWLCDQLAKVITVKEINNFAQRGVMKVSSLEFLFKSSTFQPKHIQTYITSLLSKFEVALQFDQEHLLLPSLLPTELELMEMARKKSDVRIPLRKPCDSRSSDQRYEGIRSRRSGRRLPEQTPSVLHVGTSVFYTGSQVIPETNIPRGDNLSLLAIKPTSSPILSNCRLYFMTYFPSGFWPRLITRILADESLYPIARKLFHLPTEFRRRSREVQYLSEKDPEWRCWQTGLELFFMGFEMMRIREVVFSTSSYFCDYSQCRIKCSIDSEWAFLDVLNSKILEITFPTDSLRFHVASDSGPPLQNLDFSKPSAIIYREEMITTQLLVKVVEHIDNLLQDWYPDLGELRFNQNCEGRYLVTRVIPCPQCLNREVTSQRASKDDSSWFLLNPEVPDICTPVVITSERDRSKTTCVESSSPTDLNMDEVPQNVEDVHTRQRSLTEGQAFIYHRAALDTEAVIYSWLVERCMLDVLEGVNSLCPYHGSVSPIYLLGQDGGSTQQMCIAQDVVFNDLSQSLLLPSSSQLDIGAYLGKGNFGEVHKGSLYYDDGNPPEDVAVKILFKKVAARKDISRGFQNYLEQACTAYLTVRQEVSILSRLDHPNIVPLIALCLQPLSLVLMLAPLGALDVKLRELNERGEVLPIYTVRQIVIQVAKALSYLHSNYIIYRDLKSENVLIWELPASSMDSHPTDTVDVKLADYGISRSVLPSGARGFGGTPPFIAPEILQHAGKGTYSEKVDVFSFGMFLFEVLTCRVPFATVNNPSNLVCQGERPSLTVQEAERCPSYVLDLMTLCWSQDPDQRPTMEAIQGISISPQFCHLQDVITLGPEVAVYAGCSLSFSQNTNNGSGGFGTPGAFSSPSSLDQTSGSSNHHHHHNSPQRSHSQVWLSSGFHGNNAVEIFTFNNSHRVENYRTMELTGLPIVAMCEVDGIVWCADSQGLIQMFHCETLGLVQEFKLPRQEEDASPCTVISLHPCCAGTSSVLAVASEGFLYEVEQQPVVCGLMTTLEERSPVVVVHTVEPCFCSVLVTGTKGHEVWMGHRHGAVSVWSVSSKCIDRKLSHGPKLAASSSNCAFLVTQSGVSKDTSYIWSYNYPGAVICMWNVGKSVIENKLDCSQIVSTVESPVMAPSKQFESGGQVTALSAIDNYLYIGTTRGCILVTELLTLAPLCVFQSHTARDFFVKTILPVLPPVLSTEDVEAAATATTATTSGKMVRTTTMTMASSRSNDEKNGEDDGGDDISDGGGGVRDTSNADDVIIDVEDDNNNDDGKNNDDDHDDDDEEEEEEEETRQIVAPAVVTVGMGYSNIIKTFHPDLDASPKGRLDDIGPNKEPAHITDQYTNHTFMLTWVASDWEFY